MLTKLLLAPLLIAGVSLIQRRWGPAAGGFLGGMPLTVGPALAVLAFEHGPQFAAVAAVSAVESLVAVALFSAVYALAAVRFDWNIVRCLSLALACYAVGMLLVVFLPLGLAAATIVASAAILIAYRQMPIVRLENSTSLRPPPWELALRMAASAGLVWLVAALAETLGSRASGMLTPFPVPALILGLFTHHYAGPHAAAGLLRSLVLGLFSRAVFCVVTALALPALGTANGLLLATVCTLATQAVLWRVSTARY